MSPRRTARTLLASLPLAAVISCVAWRPHPGVSLSTSPPGARVLVDGRDTGFVTPCHLGLENKRHRIDMQLEGFVPATVLLESGGDVRLIYWREAKASTNTWRFPLFLNSEDFLQPVKLERGVEPRRIYVPLESMAE